MAEDQSSGAGGSAPPLRFPWISRFQARRLKFEAQFRHENGNLVFRARCRGAARAVTPAERDRAVADFDSLGMAGFAAAVAACLIGIPAVVALVPKGQEPTPYLLVAFACLALLLFAADRWAWNRAVAAFRDRPALGASLTPIAARRMLAEWLSWAHFLILGGMIGSAFLLVLAAGTPPHGELADRGLTYVALLGLVSACGVGLLALAILKAVGGRGPRE